MGKQSKSRNNMASISLSEIGLVESPYRQKFGIPRQPGLAPAAKGRIKLLGEVNSPDAFKSIEQYSHLWLIFVFHETMAQGWKPLVRPPRLGGNVKAGVFATRSTFRPNPLGLSVVKNEGIEIIKRQVYLNISELDLLDGTPIVDIKPYLPFADALPHASSDFAPTPPSTQVEVHFAELAKQQLSIIEVRYPKLQVLIEQVLLQDPRPAYKRNKADDKVYAVSLYEFNIRWQVNHHIITVLDIT
ncbi:tRNA (N6-threonylcarbamoyladenosine(37)-N6)-methyltransferase TrmO [Motilimonas eburnea]|uniref:tRNA (N6-threonylcarbamoyladenosine(37)-N6)-methyltransferase TrmO n=1 Tax=Motilimonas eburnea TaxID=1737488 RepID=UPI001E420584|nr:tRNA (N6-threonylcarbamoyladenosine(37)-N6)-methyltransferase TrmO [Motilimonas eburnea]